MKQSRQTPLSNNIKQLRKELNLTQKQLAAKLGISYGALANYEMGFREPNSKAMVALESFFNVSGAYLRGETDNREDMSKYEDPSIMDEIDDMLTPLLNNILKLGKEEPEDNRELLFNIFVELQSILKIKDPNNKAMILELVASNVYSLNSNINRYSKKKDKAVDQEEDSSK